MYTQTSTCYCLKTLGTHFLWPLLVNIPDHTAPCCWSRGCTPYPCWWAWQRGPYPGRWISLSRPSGLLRVLQQEKKRRIELLPIITNILYDIGFPTSTPKIKLGPLEDFVTVRPSLVKPGTTGRDIRPIYNLEIPKSFIKPFIRHWQI